MSLNSFNLCTEFEVHSERYHIYSLEKATKINAIDHLPYCYKILLENLLRHEDGEQVTADHIESLCRWSPGKTAAFSLAFYPSRVVLQDFTGVPAIVDLAAMRDAMSALGGDPKLINPVIPVDLVIDHSVMVDYFGKTDALTKNTDKEFERNRERYQFLRWGQQAFQHFRVVPPGTGIVHQVNLEYLASVVTSRNDRGKRIVFPDTLVGTDSHTTMINGLGVLGWGVGGIEAEAAMLGQPMSLLLPKVVGVEIKGQLGEGVTATDLVLTVTQTLRQHGVVDKFVEFFGAGLDSLSLADRATVANMAPEYGATVGMFPVDQETLDYLRLTGRKREHIALVEAYAKTQGLWRESDHKAEYDEQLVIDLDHIEASVAGPKLPQERTPLSQVETVFQNYLKKEAPQKLISISNFIGKKGNSPHHLKHGDVVIAAITSCTNTSNPEVMLAAGLLAKKAVERGLTRKPWVKTSLAPGSKVVPAYLEQAGLSYYLDRLGFNLVGFGCTTCIGNSGPLPDDVSRQVREENLIVSAVLSGNRNFEGRVHPQVRANYLASPPLVVAYAIAGTVNTDFTREPLGYDGQGEAVYLRDLWPSHQELKSLVAKALSPELFAKHYGTVFKGSDAWRALPTPTDDRYNWPSSSYINKPPYFEGMTRDLPSRKPTINARCLVKLGDSVTTDHISPAGSISSDSAAGGYLSALGVDTKAFNSLGSRRGNHEVMVRGTFANVRLKNQLVPEKTGGYTRHIPNGDVLTVYDAAMRYQQEATPLVVIAGKDYGSGSSRDWAAKGTKLLGIEVVMAESFERIHRTNLVGFGVLPLEFIPGENAETLGLTGEELFTFYPLREEDTSIEVKAECDGRSKQFQMKIRIDTSSEWGVFFNGGILPATLRKLLTDPNNASKDKDLSVQR
ncbi:MAG: aconitate hydratase AcnA [Oleiphilus sp.]|nr:MAG: aconitate hydratase AcnA [Oleiphilus sp.]